jgi:lysophospholipase L1-like esterase
VAAALLTLSLLGGNPKLAAASNAPAGASRRVLHLGDSHTDGTAWPALLRQAREQAAGAASGGFGLPGDATCTDALVTASGWGGARDGTTGLAGEGLVASRAGASVVVSGRFAHLRFHFLAGPGGGTALLRAGGRSEETSLRASEPRVVVVEAGPGKEAEVVTRSAGTRLLGVGCDAVEGGAWYAAVGINGARADRLNAIPEPILAASLRAEAPSRVALAFGTNEARDPRFDEVAYAGTLSEALARIRRALPSAELIVVGAPDQGGVPPARLDAVVRAQRRAAAAARAQFVDLRVAMGGAGTAARWASASPPLAARDLVHFTEAGYRELARFVAPALAGVPPEAIPASARLPRVVRVAPAPARSGEGKGGIRTYRDASGRLVLSNTGPPLAEGALLGRTPR